MKRILALLLALIALLSLPMASLADGSGWVGEVIAMQISFREAPKSNAKSIGSIKNGAVVTILDDVHDGWFHVQYDGKEGYVMDEYVVENPDHMILLSSAAVYAFPHSDKRVAALSAYTRLTIIDEYDGYYVVNLREASGFIRKKNADIMLDSESATEHVVGRIRITDTTQPYSGPGTKFTRVYGELTAGQELPYISISGDWYVCILDGHYAYVWNGRCEVI